jgi:hypothetical protein
MSREPIARAPRTRPQRTSVSTKNRLNVTNKDPNYEYRLVNDVRDRVAIFKENGWEVVPAADVTVGSKRVEAPSTVGSAASIPVGLVGESAGNAVVMRIPKDWYQEDQQAKHDAIAATERSMQTEALNGNYGKIEIKR